MTQPTEAVGGEPIAPEPTLEDRLSAAFGDEQEQPQDELPAEEVEGEEPEAVEEADDDTEIEAVEDDELPPIDAPVSWDAEAKERFAKLPREDQEYLSKREGERERFVQQKSQEAARAKTESQQAAIQQLAEIERGYAQHIEQLASRFNVAEPDMALLAENPALYAQQARAYQHAQAQRHELQRQAAELSEQAQQREAYAEQQYHAEQTQKLVETLPEYLDPTTGPKLQAELSQVARELGYSPDLIAQARADDILAMKTANDWRVKAQKYDALQSKKMEKVREAKKLSPVAKPGTAQAPGVARQQQYVSDRDAMRNGDKAATQRVLDAHFNNLR